MYIFKNKGNKMKYVLKLNDGLVFDYENNKNVFDRDELLNWLRSKVSEGVLILGDDFFSIEEEIEFEDLFDYEGEILMLKNESLFEMGDDCCDIVLYEIVL